MRKLQNGTLVALTYLSATLTVGMLLFIVLYIFANGISHLTWSFIFSNEMGANGGIFPMMVTTIYMIGLALLFATPIGIFTAIYLVEYAKRGSRFVALIRLATESLAGIPSIIFGLFGFLCFVVFFKGFTLIGGAFTVAIMVLPTIIRSTEEALKTVPDAYREGSYGLGAGKLRTVFRIILPSAMHGILAAIILSIGRIVGETAAVVLTAGTVAKLPENVFSSGRTLSVHMYILAKEGIDFSKAYATAFVLLVIILVLNLMTNAMLKRLKKG